MGEVIKSRMPDTTIPGMKEFCDDPMPLPTDKADEFQDEHQMPEERANVIRSVRGTLKDSGSRGTEAFMQDKQSDIHHETMRDSWLAQQIPETQPEAFSVGDVVCLNGQSINMTIVEIQDDGKLMLIYSDANGILQNFWVAPLAFAALRKV